MESGGFLGRSIGGVSVEAAVSFAAVSIIVFAAFRLLRAVLNRYLSKHGATNESGLNNLVLRLLQSTSSLFLLIIAFYCGSYALPLKGRAEATVSSIVEVAVLVQLGIWSIRVVLYAIDDFLRRQPQDEEARLATAKGAITFIARIVVWSLVGLLVLSALKINVTALITGLGIGGLALALAAQNILGDLFASLSILLDRPFAVGHFIVVGDLAGTVEHVGIKSTRLRSLSGEEVIEANRNLLNARIHNYRHLSERRIVFGFGVTYDTTLEKLKEIPKMVREIIEGILNARFDRAHFKAYGESSLSFEVVYYVENPDYTLYMDIQQQINLELFRRFDAQRIAFAFPTQTLYLNEVKP